MKKYSISIKWIVNFLFSILSHTVFISLTFSLLTNGIRLGCLVLLHSYTQNAVTLIGILLFSIIFSLRHYQPYPLF